METLIYDKNYWDQRYKKGETGWDIGAISEPLKAYFDSLQDKSIRILIPGCGNAYEGAYLHGKGFTEVFLADISELPLKNFATLYPDFPKEHLLCVDYFELSDKFDLIVEQTFFCALHPDERKKYVEKTSTLLKDEGKLIGLLFASHFEKVGPPYGGTADEYRKLFDSHFTIELMEPAHNSIKPRLGNELFIKMRKLIV